MSQAVVDVEFCFDFASPFSYLADCQLDWVLADCAANSYQVTRVPVYLRGFEQFSRGMPYTADKAAYLVRDMQRTAEANDIPLTMPKVMPINGLYMLRGAVFLNSNVAEYGKELVSKYRHAAFKATWVDQRDVASAAAVADIAAEIGIDREAFAAGIATQPVKDELRANTAAAIARGAFGVPTIFVGGELFFGQDRLDQVKRLVDRLTSAQ